MKVYLDTSVFSALLDEREPSRQALTQAFWDSKAAYEVITSEIASREMSNNRDPALREQMLSLLFGVEVLATNDGILKIRDALLSSDVFTIAMIEDAEHVAAAVYYEALYLLSWNFRHLVNQRRRLMVNNVVVDLGFQPITILSPPEL